MLESVKSKKEFYESQSKEQLVIFLLNTEYENERLKNKLKILTGCESYGDSDGMDGSCVECYHRNPILQMKCSQFQTNIYKKQKKNMKIKVNSINKNFIRFEKR